MGHERIEELQVEKRYEEALAHALHEYRKNSTPELRTLLVNLRGLAARTLWCSPSMCLSDDPGSLAIRGDNGQVALSIFDMVLLRSTSTGEVEWKCADLKWGIDAITYSRSGERLLMLTVNKNKYRLYELSLESGKSRLLVKSRRVRGGVCRNDRICMSQSGQVLAFGSQDHPVRGYDFGSGRWFKLPGTFMAFDGSGSALCKADDGRLVETDLDHRAHANSFEPVEHAGFRLNDVAYRNGVLTYSVDRQHSRRLAVRTLASGQERVIETEHCFFNVTLSDDARYLAWSGWASISCQDLTTGARDTHSLDVGHDTRLDFLGTEALVVAGSRVRTPRFLPLPDGSARHESCSPCDLLPVHGHTCEINRIEIGREDLRAEDDGSTRHWDLRTGEQLSHKAKLPDVQLRQTESPFEGKVTGVLPCGDDVLVGYCVDDDRLWIGFNGHEMTYPMGGGIFGVCFAPSSSTVYVMVSVKMGETRLVAFDLESRSISSQLDLQKDSPGVVAVSEIRGVLATANRYDYAISVLDLSTGHLIQEMPIHSELGALAITECGTLLACGTATGSVILWQLGSDVEPEPMTDFSEEALDRWQRDTGFVGTAKGLTNIPCPGEHYRNTEWAKYCQE